MTSEVEERPSLVTGGYGRRRRQWVNYTAPLNVSVLKHRLISPWFPVCCKDFKLNHLVLFLYVFDIFIANLQCNRLDKPLTDILKF